ncbi:adenylate/guanylate cyclase domain-containing protein [Sungkyunkwania multivorans]|uniref:adenylate cyclase n=1 Tax=Sungkyunkwania multivorans TaxID=1173618 RepID=A0ABW3D0D2_9FLAO
MHEQYRIEKERYLKVSMLLFFVLHAGIALGMTNIKIIKTVNHFSLSITQKMASASKPQKPTDKKLADSLFDYANAHIKKGDFREALSSVQQALNLYTTLADHKAIGHCYNKIASIHYFQGNYNTALAYFDKSICSYDKEDFKKGVASSVNNKGAIYYYLGNYPKALHQYKSAAKLNENLNDKKQTAATIQNIGGIYLELNDHANAMKHFQIAKKTYESTSDKKALSQVLNGIGEIYLRQQEFSDALVHFEKALSLAKEVGDKQRILEPTFNLGKLSSSKKEYKKSLYYYDLSLKLAEELKNLLYQSLSLIAIGSVNYKMGKNRLAINDCKKGLNIAKEINTVSVQKDGCNCLYDVYKSIHNEAAALIYYEQAIQLKDSLRAKETAKDVLNMEFEKQLLLDSIAHVEKRHQLKIEHKQVLHEKETQRNIGFGLGLIVSILAIGLLSRLSYVRKSKAILQIEKDRSEHLLRNILPEEIAEELKQKGYVDAQDFDTASILFTDFKSFTETASRLSPQELVEEINICFKAFDAIIDHYGIEKIKTIGDAYMAAGGLPKPDTSSVKKTILAGIEMQEFITKRKSENELVDKPAFDMRVGIHVGPIVAGIVGVKKFQYDIWGDTVNIASRMESNGVIGKVNISEDVYQIIKNEKNLSFEYRGKGAVKGKGAMDMYFVDNKVSVLNLEPSKIAQAKFDGPCKQ